MAMVGDVTTQLG